MQACGVPAVAQEKGLWRAESSTAQSITGDVAFSGEKMSINFRASWLRRYVLSNRAR